MITIQDFEDHAKDQLPFAHREFFRNGASQESSLRRNVAAFQRIVLRPRFLTRDVSHRSLDIRILGQELRTPVAVAPTATQGVAHPDGEIGTAKACQATGSLFVLSTMSTARIEDVAAAAPDAVKWFQLYLNKDRDVSVKHILRAEACGFKAVVLTIDLPMTGLRHGEKRTAFALPSHMRLANFDDYGVLRKYPPKAGSSSSEWMNEAANFDDTMTWDVIPWLKSVTRLPVLVKGLLTKEDAVEAVNHGVDGIMVSNHGGRQLDCCPAPIEALPEVIQVVGGRVPVFVDGGVRTGTDVLKGLALGASAVFLGRPILWGLTAGGQAGVEQVLRIVTKELSDAMALSGCAKIADIDRSLVTRVEQLSKL